MSKSKSKLILIKTITPMHVGASEGSGFVDMPIQREASTNIPKVESSTIKGVMREYACKKGIKKVNALFGKEKKSGNLAFTDLKLLFFPVKSSKNIFSLITCPYVLERFYEETLLYNTDEVEGLKDFINYLRKLNHNKAYTLKDLGKEIYLENYLYKLKNIEKEKLFHNIKELKSVLDRIVIVSNEDFIDFTTYYTEISTRNKIDKETGTTQHTSLFTQEYIPSEAIFYGIISKFDNILLKDDKKEKENKNVKNFYKQLFKDESNLQIGGNSTLGKGIVKIIN